jgi:hypothetical protein
MRVPLVPLLLAGLALPGGVRASDAQQRRSAIGGLVVSASSLDPMPRVRVALVGTGRTTVTDTLGRFLFDSLRAATYLVQVRGDSDETPLTQVEVGDRERVDLMVKLGKPDPNRLPDLETTAYTTPPVEPHLRLPEEFVERKKLGIGQFLTAEEILRRRPPTVVDLFRTFRGMEVRCRNGNCIPHVVRSAPNCLPKVYVDAAAADVGILRGIDRDNLQAVEVYLGLSEYPVDYQLNPQEAKCGLIVIWTRFTPVRKK